MNCTDILSEQENEQLEVARRDTFDGVARFLDQEIAKRVLLRFCHNLTEAIERDYIQNARQLGYVSDKLGSLAMDLCLNGEEAFAAFQNGWYEHDSPLRACIDRHPDEAE